MDNGDLIEIDEFNELKQYVGFSAADAQQLVRFAELCEPHIEQVVTRFYARVMECPSTRKVLTSDQMAARLRVTLAAWLRELIGGPWDQAYHARRRKIGHVHVRVGLGMQYMCSAMSGVVDDLSEIAVQNLSPEQAYPLTRSIQRVCSMDLAIMSRTYVERRESQQLGRLQDLILTHMPMVVFLVDSENCVVASTGAAEAMLGIGKLQGLPLDQALHEGLIRRSQMFTLMEKARVTGEIQVNPRVDWTSRGGLRTYRCTVIPIDGPISGTLRDSGMLVHIEDLTQTVTLEARIQQKDALERLGAMSASVAHELRNPLAGISGAIQVISSTMKQEDSRRRTMELISQQIHRLDALVGDLLAFGRPPHYHPGRVDLAEVIENVVQMVQSGKSEVVYETVGSGSVSTDRDLVIQVLLNLVQNASQAIGGVGWVRMSCGDDWVMVTDSGPGIPAKNRAQIFQPFFTTRARGTGLGLAICQRAVETMGGRLQLIQSEPGEGACFRLDFHVNGEPAF
jgi:signal transduction histidine kinase